MKLSRVENLAAEKTASLLNLGVGDTKVCPRTMAREAAADDPPEPFGRS